MLPLLTRNTEGINGEISYDFVDEDAKQKFRQVIKPTVQIIYRACPEVRHMFVAALKKSGSNCAYTGNSINDCLCLSEANVGFAMGANCNAVA